MVTLIKKVMPRTQKSQLQVQLIEEPFSDSEIDGNFIDEDNLYLKWFENKDLLRDECSMRHEDELHALVDQFNRAPQPQTEQGTPHTISGPTTNQQQYRVLRNSTPDTASSRSIYSTSSGRSKSSRSPRDSRKRRRVRSRTPVEVQQRPPTALGGEFRHQREERRFGMHEHPASISVPIADPMDARITQDNSNNHARQTVLSSCSKREILYPRDGELRDESEERDEMLAVLLTQLRTYPFLTHVDTSTLSNSRIRRMIIRNDHTAQSMYSARQIKMILIGILFLVQLFLGIVFKINIGDFWTFQNSMMPSYEILCSEIADEWQPMGKSGPIQQLVVIMAMNTGVFVFHDFINKFGGVSFLQTLCLIGMHNL